MTGQRQLEREGLSVKNLETALRLYKQRTELNEIARRDGAVFFECRLEFYFDSVVLVRARAGGKVS